MLVVEILGVTLFSQTNWNWILKNILQKTREENERKWNMGLLLLLKFEMFRVRGAKMKCTMSAHFIKNVNEHLCLCVFTFDTNACAFMPVRVKAYIYVKGVSYLSIIFLTRILHLYELKTSLSHAHTCCTWLIVWFTVFVKYLPLLLRDILGRIQYYK